MTEYMSTKIHHNNFGMLRLLFACLVILSHSPWILYGDYSNEILTKTFGTMDIGSVALDGFFLISGYLVTMSYQHSYSIKNYLLKRCLRIFPGFAIASLISVFIFAPMSYGWQAMLNLPLSEWIKIPLRIITLQQPWVANTLHNTKHSSEVLDILNHPMWSIRYEFACYISVVFLSVIGLQNRKYFLLVTVLSMLTLMYCLIQINYFHHEIPFQIFCIPRLFFAFLIGSAFYIYQYKIIWNNHASWVCAILLLTVFSNQYLAEPTLILLGGYILFNFALNFKSAWLSKIGTNIDMSYGVYLYAWPIQVLIAINSPSISPWSLTLYALILSMLMGYFSWKLVEKPCLQMKHYLQYQYHF
jgi:peptidoglycan/LPS O-acetylase OafA/YrhL